MELDFSEQIKKMFISTSEKTCPNCGEPMSKCECDTSKSKKSHPDKEDKKDKEMEKGDPDAEKKEEMDEESKAKQSQESKDIKDIEKKGEMNKAGKACAKHGEMNCAKCEAEWQDSKAKKDESKEDPKQETGESQEEEDQEDEKDMKDKKKMSKASLKVVSFLENKINKFNENNDRQITLAQILEVFNRGAKAYENNHRVGVSRNQWAFARVNSFLKLVSNQSVHKAYAKVDSDILNNDSISENTEFTAFAEIEFQLAKIAVLECGLSDTEANEEILFAEDKKKTLIKH